MPQSPECKIEWDCLKLPEWRERFGRIRRSTVLQSYEYAQAMCQADKVRARWGLIKIDDKEAGLVQILHSGILWNLFQAVILDRGPLWFEGFGGAAQIKAFFDTLNGQYPKRFGRKRRILPEIEDGPTAQTLLKQGGLEKLDIHRGYQTLWWNLNQNEEEALLELKDNWRGSLRRAYKAELNVQWDDSGKFYSWLRDIYAADKQKRGYGGISPQFLDILNQFSSPSQPMIIGKATRRGQDIAAVMFIQHGKSATYQIGWNSPEGREHCAHHLLLWEARTMLQRYGVIDLDLGGINEESAQGVKNFKEGTGAKISKLVGHYR